MSNRVSGAGDRSSRFGNHFSGFGGFTLIELLVVIAVIALLAAMIFPIGAAIDRAKKRSKARAELAQVEVAIAAYKTKLGFYPPDNPNNPAVNQLYFELSGTFPTNGQQAYITLDGASLITTNALGQRFNAGGILNSTQGGGDEGHGASKFLNDLKPGQIGDLSSLTPGAKIIVCSIPWPSVTPTYWPAGVLSLNPIRYNSSHPTNNPGSFDLWVDVIIGGKTNRISNWSREPLIVSTP
jgi:prepilin-type N-terminal cleavage/methylation domain-containing protein